MKKPYLSILIVLLFVSALSCMFFMPEKVSAFAEDNITLRFYNGDSEISCILESDTYYVDYVEGLRLSVKGFLAQDAAATSSMKIRMENGVYDTCDWLAKAGNYELMITVAPTSGLSVSKTIKLCVKKKSVSAISFINESINIHYGYPLNPIVSVAEAVKSNSTFVFKYYSSAELTSQIDKPSSVGTYWVEVTLDSLYYEGSCLSQFTISKADCLINIDKKDAEFTFSKANAGVNGYDVLAELGAYVSGVDIGTSYYTLQTFVKKDGELEYSPKSTINETGFFYVEICFVGEESNFEHYRKYATIRINKAETTFRTNGNITIRYDCIMDISEVFDALFMNKEQGYWLINTFDYSDLNDISSSTVTLFVFDENDDITDTFVPVVGTFWYRLVFEGNEFYNGTDSGKCEFSIYRRDISTEISLESSSISFIYGTPVNLSSKYVIPVGYNTVPPELSYFSLDEQNAPIASLDGIPSEPGRYALKIVLDENNYYCSKSIIFTISKLLIPNDKCVLNGLSSVYGQQTEVSFSAEGYTYESYDLFYYKDEALLDAPPTQAGEYTVTVVINDPLYTTEKRGILVIEKKQLKATALSKTVVYGNDPYSLDTKYSTSDVRIDGLVTEDDLNSVLDCISILIGEEGLTKKSASLTVGTHSLCVVGTHPNYEITDYQSGEMTVSKRKLNLAADALEVYVGLTVTPTFSVSNLAYGALAEDYKLLFETYYTTQDGEELSGLPAVAGNYLINVRALAGSAESRELANYSLNSTPARLVVLSNEKKDNYGHMTVVGKFEPSQDLVVRSESVTKELQNAVAEQAGRYNISLVYYVPYTFSTKDNSSFKVRLNVANVSDKSDIKLLISYTPGSYMEVPYTVIGNEIELTQKIMASYYIILTPHTINIKLIIICSVAGGVVILAVAIFLFLYFSGRLVRTKKSSQELSSAVAAPVSGKKSEDDEFFEMIESFDESTVEHTTLPAERLAKKAEDELREQYRLKLRRMRSMGDKSISDRMREVGLNSESFDEEEAITKMIEADREKKRLQEEADKRIKEEAEAQKKSETTFVVNQRKTGTLNSGVVASKKDSDDDDIDI